MATPRYLLASVLVLAVPFAARSEGERGVPPSWREAIEDRVAGIAQMRASSAPDDPPPVNGTRWTATVVVGSAPVLATSFGLAQPSSVATDHAGRIYVADSLNHRVERIEGNSLIRIAGTGVPGFSGDGGPAAVAQLHSPSGVAIDRAGRIYVADATNNCVRRIDAAGIITTWAGTCGSPYTYFIPGTNNTGDGGPALAAAFAAPVSVAVDRFGRVYVVDALNHVVRRIDERGTIDRVAGTGTVGTGGDDGPATDADLASPAGVCVDDAGALYVADTDNGAIRKIDEPGTPARPGIIRTVAGVLGEPAASDDGPVATTHLLSPKACFVGPSGILTFSDTGTSRIRQVVGDSVVTVAGSEWGFSGDGGPAIAARLAGPSGAVVDASGRIVIADSDNHRIRSVDAAAPHTIRTIAGSGAFGVLGDGGAATSASGLIPLGVTADASGNVYFSDGWDGGNYSHSRIRRVDAAGTITTVAGEGDSTTATVPFPDAIAVDSQGRVHFFELGSAIVWRIDPTGLVRVAGGGTSLADGGLATEADLGEGGFAIVRGIAFDARGRMYLSSNAANGRVRRVDVPDGMTGVVTTVAGGGSETGDTTGPNAPLDAKLTFPRGIAFDEPGRLYIADGGGSRIVRVDFEAPSLTRIAGGSGNTQLGEGVPPLSAKMSPVAVAVDAGGNVFYADPVQHRVRRIDRDLRAISTIAGSQDRLHGDFGDGGPATGPVDVARLFAPVALALDPHGRLLVADVGNRRVRRVELDGTITTLAGAVAPEGMGPAKQARLMDPRALVALPGMTLAAGGSSGTVQAVRSGSVAAVIGRYPHSVPTSNLAKFRDRTFGTVSGIAADAAASVLYVAESNRIHHVAMTPSEHPDRWTIEPFANVVDAGGYGDGDVETATFQSPSGLFFDEDGLYVADTGNHAIRRILGGLVTTVAGQGQLAGYAGDGGPATDALLRGPEAVTRCGNGDWFVADTGNGRIRRIHGGVISTVLGPDGPSRSYRPKGVACDAAGNVYVSSEKRVLQLVANEEGRVDGSGRVRTIYASRFTACLAGLVLIDATTLQVADQCTGVVVELRPSPAGQL